MDKGDTRGRKQQRRPPLNTQVAGPSKRSILIQQTGQSKANCWYNLKVLSWPAACATTGYREQGAGA